MGLLVMVRSQKTGVPLQRRNLFGSGELRSGFSRPPASKGGVFEVAAMKKGKKLATEAFPAAGGYPVGEEARLRFRHQSLLQDYEDLRKETEAKKKKLQKAAQKKLKLLAEVNFLRRRYKSLVQNPSGNLQFRLIKKPSSSPPSQLLLIGQTSTASFQLPAEVQSHKRRDATTPSTSGLIDLNQVSEPVVDDMNEFQFSFEPAKADKSMKSLTEGDATANDLKLSICRDVGHGSSQVVKRKITWQDQVALRV